MAVETGDRLGAFTDALMEILRRRDHNVSFFNLASDINTYLKEQGEEQRTVLTSANYNTANASITRSMIMSSRLPPYRERARSEVVARDTPSVSLYEYNRRLAINQLRRMIFTNAIK